MALKDYQSRLNIILRRADLAETAAAKMQILGQLDDLYLLVFNKINSEYEHDPAKLTISALQDFEETIATAKTELSKKILRQALEFSKP